MVLAADDTAARSRSEPGCRRDRRARGRRSRRRSPIVPGHARGTGLSRRSREHRQVVGLVRGRAGALDVGGHLQVALLVCAQGAADTLHAANQPQRDLLDVVRHLRDERTRASPTTAPAPPAASVTPVCTDRSAVAVPSSDVCMPSSTPRTPAGSIFHPAALIEPPRPTSIVTGTGSGRNPSPRTARARSAAARHRSGSAPSNQKSAPGVRTAPTGRPPSAATEPVRPRARRARAPANTASGVTGPRRTASVTPSTRPRLVENSPDCGWRPRPADRRPACSPSRRPRRSSTVTTTRRVSNTDRGPRSTTSSPPTPRSAPPTTNVVGAGERRSATSVRAAGVSGASPSYRDHDGRRPRAARKRSDAGPSRVRGDGACSTVRSTWRRSPTGAPASPAAAAAATATRAPRAGGARATTALRPVGSRRRVPRGVPAEPRTRRPRGRSSSCSPPSGHRPWSRDQPTQPAVTLGHLHRAGARMGT